VAKLLENTFHFTVDPVWLLLAVLSGHNRPLHVDHDEGFQVFLSAFKQEVCVGRPVVSAKYRQPPANLGQR
jgi:hypothetical protein